MITENFRDILSTIDYGIVDNNPKYNGIERLEKVRNYILKNILDKIPVWHITSHINTMIKNLFHESNEKLKEDCIELRKLLLHWYDDEDADVDKDQSDDEDEDKYKYKLPVFRLSSSEQMVVKVKESFEKTRHVKNNDKSKKYNLRGERNVKYYERVLSNKKEFYNFNCISN